MDVRTVANELSVIGFVFDFTDDDDKAIPPKTFHWSLVDAAGNVVNQREQVAQTPAAQITVTLVGDDLQVMESERPFLYAARRLIVQVTYDSDLGADLPLNESKSFVVKNLAYIGSEA